MLKKDWVNISSFEFSIIIIVHWYMGIEKELKIKSTK
jgi:hypothetical protein